jgi:mannose-6-phosphate isomerase
MQKSHDFLGAFLVEPQYRDYVWGGNRLRPGNAPTAEAWIISEEDKIITGPLSGLTLSEAAKEHGADLLGERVVKQTQNRFPILIKLLDCAQWLSLQVHPNNEQAVELEGPGHFGKTEAWHIIDADPGAELLCGFKPGVENADWQQSVRDGSILEYTNRIPVSKGESLFIRPGTMHALGPGLFVYEVQQTSNITYRVFDWNRPKSEGRVLHIDQSIRVLDPSSTGKTVPPPVFVDGQWKTLVACPFFTLAHLSIEKEIVRLDPAHQTFHAITVIEGEAELKGDGWGFSLKKFETVLVPASAGIYQIEPVQHTQILKSSVEPVAP